MKKLNTNRLAKLIAASLLSVGMSVRAAAPDPGIGSLLWPLVIIASPFIVVHDLIYGTDDGARSEADAKANAIFATNDEQIPVKGLYTASLDLTSSIKGMLVESRLPFIEVSTVGSAWLLRQAMNPQPLVAQAQNFPYMRLSLGEKNQPNCFAWASASKEFTAAPPVSPSTCLLVTFTSELQSDLQLDVDTTLVSKRELRWVLIDRINNRTLLSVPFWNTQSDGQPLQAFALYQSASDNNSFSRIIKKLNPKAISVRTDGRPFVLNRMLEPTANESLLPRALVQGRFRESKLTWGLVGAADKQATWEKGYSQGVSSGSPTIMNDELVFDPKSSTVGRACAFPPGEDRCRLAWKFATNLGLISTSESASNQAPIYKTPKTNEEKRDMRLNLAIRTYHGQLFWLGEIGVQSYPDSYQVCTDGQYLCLFYPSQAITTEEELIIHGSLVAAIGYGQRGSFELVVPLKSLHPISQP